MSHKIRYACICVKKALWCALILAAGYMLGNAFPTFEVVPYGYKAQRFDPVGLEPFVELKDFDDEVTHD